MTRKNSKQMLSPREKEVLKHIRDGKATCEISSKLGISERTVKFHIGNILRKLGATNRAHAVAITMEKTLFKQY